MRGKHLKLKAQAVQKEQYRLVQVEKILTKLLTKVNENLNELKVEKLHLKSCLIEQYTTNTCDELPCTSAQAAMRDIKTDDEEYQNVAPSNISIDMEGVENINNQILALESLLVPLKQRNYADMEEEDDDDDDDYVPNEFESE